MIKNTPLHILKSEYTTIYIGTKQLILMYLYIYIYIYSGTIDVLFFCTYTARQKGSQFLDPNRSMKGIRRNIHINSQIHDMVDQDMQDNHLYKQTQSFKQSSSRSGSKEGGDSVASTSTTSASSKLPVHTLRQKLRQKMTLRDGNGNSNDDGNDDDDDDGNGGGGKYAPDSSSTSAPAPAPLDFSSDVRSIIKRSSTIKKTNRLLRQDNDF